jgi:hypothetical protein
MHVCTLTIHDFTDAALVALGLHDLCSRYAAVALVDEDDDTVLDLRPYFGDDACVVCASEWASEAATGWRDAAVGVVLFSSDGRPVTEVREHDIELFRRLRSDLEAERLDLIDWIQTDGDCFRSLAFTCDTNPYWPDEPRT